MEEGTLKSNVDAAKKQLPIAIIIMRNIYRNGMENNTTKSCRTQEGGGSNVNKICNSRTGGTKNQTQTKYPVWSCA